MKRLSNTDPVDTGRKLNVQRGSSERLMYVQFTFFVYWGEADLRKALLIKSVYIQLSQVFHLSVSYHYVFLRDKYLSRSFAITFEKNSRKKLLLHDSCLVEPQTFSMNLWTNMSVIWYKKTQSFNWVLKPNLHVYISVYLFVVTF